MVKTFPARRGAILALVFASLSSVVLYLATVVANNSWEYSWLIWNLTLAWVPLVLATATVRLLHKKRWSSWPAAVLTIAWLLFLPNSFYIVTDYLHLFGEQRPEFMLDLAMFTSFAVNGVILGYASLYILHQQVRSRINSHLGLWLVGAALLISSYGIYMGRFLRWNSWDVIVNAPVVLVDISNSILYASTYQHIVSTVFGFFVLLASTYVALWYVLRYICKIQN
jgi:uncharacterized membrane protein